jgi:4-hydroxythreonine-4-phosphate dehydrogenase
MKKKIISITTGDLDGIGLEVTMKALHSFTSPNTTYLIFREKKIIKNWKPLPKKITLSTTSLQEALTEARTLKSPYKYIEVLSSDSPALWVKDSAQLCLDQVISGLTTGPVSKKTFIDAHLGSVGHTPLLCKICHTSNVYMGFLGHSFNVLLLSGHIPLNQVEPYITKQNLTKAFPIILKWIDRYFPEKLAKRPLGVLGLNPHNGENGLIGDYEQEVLKKIINKHNVLKGPLVPDVAFFKENWKKYSFFIALYHDQGLIPFKMIHGRTGGCHVSVGLPIVRTSVDHGTATDIFGKGCAKPDSMIAALKWCSTLIKRKETFNGL